jgi:hypothetical protein
MSLLHREPLAEMEPGALALRRSARAARDLAEQQARHAHDTEVMDRIADAVRRNHLAELMYQALSARRSE